MGNLTVEALGRLHRDWTIEADVTVTPATTLHFPMPGSEKGHHHFRDILAKNVEPQLNRKKTISRTLTGGHSTK